MSDISLWTLTEEHTSVLASLEDECFSCPWSEDGLLELLKNERFHFIGLLEGDSLVGYGSLAVLLDEGDVARIAVLPDRRGKGYGKMLLTALCDEARARGVLSLYLEVRESNAVARHLYESFGFEADGIRKNYYTRPQENAVLMTKKL